MFSLDQNRYLRFGPPQGGHICALGAFLVSMPVGTGSLGENLQEALCC